MNITVTIDSKELQNEFAKALKPFRDRNEYVIELLENLVNGNHLKLYTVKEFSGVVGRCQKTIRNLMKAGKIKYQQTGTGHKIMIPHSEILVFKQL